MVNSNKLQVPTHLVSAAIFLDDFKSWVESYTSDDVTNFWCVDFCVTTIPEVKKLEDFLGLCNRKMKTVKKNLMKDFEGLFKSSASFSRHVRSFTFIIPRPRHNLFDPLPLNFCFHCLFFFILFFFHSIIGNLCQRVKFVNSLFLLHYQFNFICWKIFKNNSNQNLSKYLKKNISLW